jgi:allantoicase
MFVYIQIILDLASSALGSTIPFVTNEFFAAATNMINPAPPVHAPGRFVGKFFFLLS